jgi:hypothetical protein
MVISLVEHHCSHDFTTLKSNPGLDRHVSERTLAQVDLASAASPIAIPSVAGMLTEA